MLVAEVEARKGGKVLVGLRSVQNRGDCERNTEGAVMLLLVSCKMCGGGKLRSAYGYMIYDVCLVDICCSA